MKTRVIHVVRDEPLILGVPHDVAVAQAFFFIAWALLLHDWIVLSVIPLLHLVLALAHRIEHRFLDLLPKGLLQPQYIDNS